MTMDETIAVIEEKNWMIAESSSEYGYKNHDSQPGQRVGEKYIAADIGPSGHFWYVRAYWGFDKNGKLIDVYVIKYSMI